MKQKKHLFLITLLPLLMSNSPAPKPVDEVYLDIDVQCEFIDTIDDNYYYEITVTNIGEKYANALNVRYVKEYDYYYSSVRGNTFSNEFLKPNQSATYRYVTDQEIDLNNKDYQWLTFTYIDRDDECSYSNITVKSTGSENNYQIEADKKGEGNYNYYYIVDVTYDGKEYAFQNLNFTTTEAIDLNKLTVNKIIAFRGRKKPDQGVVVLGGILVFFLRNVHWILLGELAIGIACAILIPLLVRRKRRINRLKKEQREKEKENSTSNGE